MTEAGVVIVGGGAGGGGAITEGGGGGSSVVRTAIGSPDKLPDLLAGIYRHYKGHYYQVFGYAHDANADDLFMRSIPGDEIYDAEAHPMRNRMVVVYMGLQLDDADEGPRLAVRSVSDFFLEVCTNALHQHFGQKYLWADKCRPTPRFKYVASEWRTNA